MLHNKCHIVWHFIWVFTDCQYTNIGVTNIRVKYVVICSIFRSFSEEAMHYHWDMHVDGSEKKLMAYWKFDRLSGNVTFIVTPSV